jgi:signal transduction histidine kinase
MDGVLQTAGAACHEINQPLQEIIGLIDIIQLQHEDNEIAGKLTPIKRAVERLAGIVRKLNSITRYETKQYSGGATIIDLDRASLPTFLPPLNPEDDALHGDLPTE